MASLLRLQIKLEPENGIISYLYAIRMQVILSLRSNRGSPDQLDNEFEK